MITGLTKGILKMQNTTETFKFMDTQIEFCCGLAMKDGNFLISFGYQDNAAFVLKMPVDVLDQLEYIDISD